MHYTYKFWQELGWAVFVALVTFLATQLLNFDAAAVTDWRVWGIAIASGGVRAIAAAVVAAFSGRFVAGVDRNSPTV
jgi:hypothetical protein